MDYTKSVYVPEVALQHSKQFKALQDRNNLSSKVGVDASQGEAVICQMLKALRAQQNTIESLTSQLDRAKADASQKFKSHPSAFTHDNEQIDEVIDLQNRPSVGGKEDNAAISGGISSSGANAIDHSIDTLQLEQYDYVEEVRLN